MPPRNTSTSENATDAATIGAQDGGATGERTVDRATADVAVDVVATRPPTLVPVGSSGEDTAPPGDPLHDARWFEALVRAHSTAVHRFLVRRTGRDDADDLTADVLTIAWRRRDDIPDGAELPWLYRTAGFLVANHRRKARPLPVADVPDEADPFGSSDPAHLFVEDEQVRTVLGALGARDRQILLLNAWEGLVGEGLAAVLGISRGGADAALSRARARLREAWAAADA
ncbi:RNA polymerase sigma factor [Cellulomonas sp. URHD0024]|uniref:RNA polymerase sigma factor n=1 Tax=Cellulomonas sp. URHD0024 TaxID=1302620 RepID=UPI0003FDB5DF|nr:sigma-70 family RNA polymerase sigma factor [Cellulomonas sp. URHD0024]